MNGVTLIYIVVIVLIVVWLVVGWSNNGQSQSKLSSPSFVDRIPVEGALVQVPTTFTARLKPLLSASHGEGTVQGKTEYFACYNGFRFFATVSASYLLSPVTSLLVDVKPAQGRGTVLTLPLQPNTTGGGTFSGYLAQDTATNDLIMKAMMNGSVTFKCATNYNPSGEVGASVDVQKITIPVPERYKLQGTSSITFVALEDPNQIVGHGSVSAYEPVSVSRCTRMITVAATTIPIAPPLALPVLSFEVQAGNGFQWTKVIDVPFSMNGNNIVVPDMILPFTDAQIGQLTPAVQFAITTQGGNIIAGW